MSSDILWYTNNIMTVVTDKQMETIGRVGIARAVIRFIGESTFTTKRIPGKMTRSL